MTMVRMVKHFEHIIPEYNQSIAFVDPEDRTRWVIGWKDVYVVRVEGGESYDVKDLTLWFPLPPIS